MSASDPNEEPTGLASVSAELEAERQRWRHRMLGGVAWSLAAASGFASFWYFMVPSPGRQLASVLASISAVISVVAALRVLSFVARTLLLVAAVYLACTYALLLAGFAANAILGLATIVVVATLLLGRRAGLVTVAITSLSVLGVALVHRAGLFQRIPEWQAVTDSTNSFTIPRVTGIFALLTTTMVIGISYLVDRSQRLLTETARSLAELRKEQLEKERIQRELELNESAFQKARELEILGRLAGTMAHDFNNSLLVIWSSLEELTFLGPLPPQIEPAIASMRAAAEQAAAATRQLRAFGPTVPRHPTALLLRPVLEKTVVMLSRLLPSNIELVAVVEVDAIVAADEGEILRVLTNLALNARDAMRDGGKLMLRARAPRASEPRESKDGAALIVIEVEDTGTGMTDAVKERLFEPFFTTKQASGTGLGLASVREVVETQGGSVTVTSTLGSGTTISLFWPTKAEAALADAQQKAPRRSGPVVALVVDDDDAVRRAISRGLARSGITVLEASDGASALQLARRHAGPIDVLCTDCVMPGVPAVQLIERFRELHPGRVIVCSGYAPADTGLSPHHFDDFLPKPFTSDTLVSRIHAVLAQRSD